MSRNEAKTIKELVNPKLKAAGWFEHNWQLDPEYKITKGRIHFDGKIGKRDQYLYADYLMRYKSSLPIALIEAKAEDKHHEEGRKQALEYAKQLGLFFSYATNGHQIEFYNLKQSTQEIVSRFHSPEELFKMYLKEAQLDLNDQDRKTLTYDYYDESSSGKRRSLRYYQENAITKTIEAIIQGQKRVLINMATGTGKTYTAIQLIYKLWKSQYVKKILFMVDRNILATQAFDDFAAIMDKDSCYRLEPSDDKFPLGRDLYFGIYQTLVGGTDDDDGTVIKPDRFKEFPENYFDLIVIDEAHRGARTSRNGEESSSWFRLLEYFKSSVQIGLTATPKREESNDTYAYFGKPIISYSLKNGIEDGYLAPYIIKRVTSNIDALGFRPDSSNIQDVRGQKLELKDYLTPDFERKLSIPQRTRAFAYHLLRHLMGTDPLGKTIVFCINQEHALDMAKYCREAFNQYKEKYTLDHYEGDYALRITGNDKNSKGKYPDLVKFQDVESHQPIIVTTSKLLTTGVDVSNIKNIVLFRNVGSMVEFKQIIGRGTRVYETGDERTQKLGFYILEYANYSTQLFNDPEWDDNPEDFIDEGPLIVEDEDSFIHDVPKTKSELEKENKRTEEEEDDLKKDIRYRMSEDFLSGRIKMAAESITFTGSDGKPISQDEYILYQSEMFLEHVKDINALNSIWQDHKYRHRFLQEELRDYKISIENLHSIFFEKYAKRNVDSYDILASLIFKKPYLTKEERINKARELNPKLFERNDLKQNSLVKDLVEIYKSTNYKPFTLSQELFQLPKIQNYGGYNGIKNILGGEQSMMEFNINMQKAIYDSRITA
jgi:type I restriction enzyme R subunit